MNDNFVNMREIDPGAMAPHGASSVDAYINTLINILKSDSVIERAALEVKSGNRSSQSSSAGSAQSGASLLASDARVREMMLRDLANHLRVRQIREGNIVEVLFESDDPKFAADFANALTNQFIEEQMQSRWKMAQRTADWLSRELVSVKKELERSESELQAYTRKTGLLVTQEKQNLVEEKLRQIQQEFSSVQADRMAKESLYRAATTAKSVEAVPAVLDHGPLRDLQVKQAELRRQLAEMASTLTPENYKVKRIQAQITETENALSRERSRVVDRVRNDYTAAKLRESLLSKEYDRQAHLVNEQAKNFIHYRALSREADSNRSLYESMLGRMKNAALASAMRASNVRVVDPATPPVDPHRPNVMLNVGTGLFGGFLLSVALVVGTARKGDSLEEPGQAITHLALPELGAVPSSQVPQRQLLATVLQGSLLNPRSPMGLRLLKKGQAPSGLELRAWNSKPSFLTDSFQTIVASLLLSTTDRRQIIVVTSPHPKDGKTTVVSHLGVALARAGQQILIVDADSRAGRLEDLFDVKRRHAQASINQASGTVADSKPDIKKTDVPGLSIMAGCDWEPERIMMKFSKLRDSFHSLRNDYDTILIDTPPMLLMPSARVLGRLADGVVLVLRARKTSFDDAQACARRLAGDEIPLLGTVLNDWRADTREYYRYYAAQA